MTSTNLARSEVVCRGVVSPAGLAAARRWDQLQQVRVRTASRFNNGDGSAVLQLLESFWAAQQAALLQPQAALKPAV